MTDAFVCETGEKRDVYRLLALAVREVWGIPCPEVEKDAYGKPRFPARPDIFFSLSHTRTHVMAAVGDVPVGCDIEVIRPVRDNVVRRVCTPEELETLDFFELWTLKESFFKLHGHLPHPMWESRFSRQNGRVLTPDPTVRAALWQIGPTQSALTAPGGLPAYPQIISKKNLP